MVWDCWVWFGCWNGFGFGDVLLFVDSCCGGVVVWLLVGVVVDLWWW